MEFFQRQEIQVKTFLARIGLEPEDTICLAVIKKAKSDREKDTRIQRFVKVRELERYLAWLRHENARDGNIYITPCKMLEQVKHRTKENFLPKQRVFWLDLDSKAMLASVLLQKVFTLLPIPTCLVRSSRSNYQAYWVLENKCDFNRLAGIMEYLNQTFQLDHTQDISRILRLPGFWNRKLGKEGGVKNDMCYLVERIRIGEKDVTVTGRRLSQAEFAAVENKLGLLNNSSSSQLKTEPNGNGKGEVLDILTVAQSSFFTKREKGGRQVETNLDKLYEWFKAKVGHKYQSQSEADMAFVCSAIRRGYQEITVKETLKKYVDSTKHQLEAYVSRTYKEAVRYLGK